MSVFTKIFKTLKGLFFKGCFTLILISLSPGTNQAATLPGTIISNIAQVTFSVIGTPGFSVTSNTEQVTIVSNSNIATVTAEFNDTTLYAGDSTTLTLTVINNGGLDLTNASLIVTLPSEPGNGISASTNISKTGNDYQIDVPDIAASSTTVFTLSTTISIDQLGGSLNIPIAFWANGSLFTTFIETISIRARTQVNIETLYYDSSNAAAPVTVNGTDYRGGDGSYYTVPVPTLPSSTTLVTDAPVSLIPAYKFQNGQSLFIQIDDADQNNDATVLDWVDIAVTSSLASDTEVFRVYETGLDTGIFLAYIPTSSNATATYDGLLNVSLNDEVTLSYADDVDANDAMSVSSLVDPFGIIFDSSTGLGVDGVTITLIDVATGQAATVFGDDGVSLYPSTMVTGQSVTDAAGTVYSYPRGNYRFPLLVPGEYRLALLLPTGAGFTAPSIVPTPTLQALPFGPFAMDVGSRGEVFRVNPGPPLHLDLPIDPITGALFVKKQTSKTLVANGDFVQYSVSVENVTTLMNIANARIIDQLPQGFRYQKGSTRLDDAQGTDPSIGGKGRELSFTLGTMAPGDIREISYVVAVAAAKPGKAINRARALGDGAADSNIAQKSVLVKDELMRNKSILMGRVINRGPDGQNEQGLAGIRIYLEDGTYTVSDERGMYHFEGILPGTHVVQLDIASLPEGYEVLSVIENTRSAGTAFSRFIDLQGGTLWTEDFYVAKKIPAKGEISLRMEHDTDGYQLTLNNTAVPVSNVRLLVMLGKNEQYAAQSARLDGKVFQEPVQQGNVITYRFSQFDADSESVLKFNVFLADQEAVLSGKAALMFDTPAKKGVRTQIVTSQLLGKADNTGVSIETDSRASAELSNPATPEKLPPTFDKIWFDTDATALMGRLLSSNEMPPYCSVGKRRSDFQAFAAGQNAWLWPSADHLPAISSENVVIKHAPGDKVTLYLDGEAVSGFHFEGGLKIIAGDAEVGLSRWRGINLVEGDNHFMAVINNAAGIEIDRLACVVHYSSPPVSARFVEEKSTLIADGINPPVIAVRLLDKTGFPAREGIFGEFSIEEPYRPLRKIKAPIEVMPGAPQIKNEFIVEKDGIVYIQLEPTTQTGLVKVTFPLLKTAKIIKTRLRPQKRDWILVGFAEGTAGYNTLSGNIEGLSGKAAEDFYSDGQLKFYAKGQIKGEWLLTMAYDSEKDTHKNKLFQTIDPGTFYTLYGDTSRQRYDAASSEKLYLKLERDDFYALFGDFDTNLSVTELTRYQRSLTGLKSEYFGGKYQFNFFVSESNQAYAKEEIRGQGISGPYALTRQNIVMNSEKITIQTRDRFRSEVIVSSETVSRHLDYDIDYDKGTIIFRKPIFSTDGGFNPIFIVVEYESFDETDRSVSYGGRIALNKPTEPFEVGLTHIEEGVVGGKSQMQGLDAAYDISKETRISAEIAETRVEDNLGNKKGEAYLLELKHQAEKWDAKAYFREVGVAFGLGQLNNSEAGTRKFGVDTTLRHNKNLGVKGQAYRQKTLSTGATREILKIDSTLRLKKSNLNAGFTRANDTLGTGETQSSNLLSLGGDRSILNGKLIFRARQDLALAQAQNSDYPEKSILGADYQLNKKAILFAEQEWANGNNTHSQSSRVGIKTKKSSLFTEQKISNGKGLQSETQRIGAKTAPWEKGEIVTTFDRVNNGGTETDRGIVGLSQEWLINERWSMGAGYERGETFRSKSLTPINPNVPFANGGTGDFYAISLGLTYKYNGYLWTSRLETRSSEASEKNYLATSLQTEVNRNLGLLTSFTLTDDQQKASQNNFKSKLRIGVAYRPAEGKWIVLDKLDLIHEKVGSVVLPYQNYRVVNNLNANYRANRKWQLSLQYGAKLLRETINNKAYESFINLLGAEMRYDLNKKWDIGFRTSTLHSWLTRQYDASYGVSLGHSFAKNVWASLGYNFEGFRDEDFSLADYTSQGVFVKFRMKFDQESVKGGLAWLRG